MTLLCAEYIEYTYRTRNGHMHMTDFRPQTIEYDKKYAPSGTVSQAIVQ